jgi:hypothetical protein
MRTANRIWAAAFLAIALTLIGSVRIASTYKVFNFTIDEPEHAACGIEWLDAGKYDYDLINPPLSRIVAALGLHYAGRHWDGDSNMWYEGFRVLGAGPRHERGLVYGRAAMLLFFWIAAAVVFLWALRTASPVAAVLATAFYTTLPPILGHAGLVTTDVALTAMLGAAALASIYWAERPTVRRTLILGVAVGLALVTKYSALVFLPSAWLAMLAWSFFSRRENPLRNVAHFRNYLAPSAIALGIAAFVIWAAYRFDVTRIAGFPYFLPAPGFFGGIQDLWRMNLQPHWAYVLGRRSLSGFWYYYPVALAAKTPIAMLIVIAIGFVTALPFRLRIGLPLAFSAGVLLFAMTSRINVGSRHVLPVYIGLSITAGVALAGMIARTSPRWLAACGIALLAAHVISGALQHPDYLAYTNAFWWRDPEAVLADSDVDWGQDMKRLADRLKALHVDSVYFDPFNRGYLMAGAPFPKIRPVPDGHAPPLGWTAVSITMWKLGGGPRWLASMRPEERVGRSILLFHRQ